MANETQTVGIAHEERDGSGAFFLACEGIRLAELTYTRVGPHRVTIDHTVVDDQLRGLGVAKRLFDSAIAWARATRTKVTATCAYARGQFEQDSSIRDVLDTKA